MQRNMNSSPPRLPRLGGHKSSPTRRAVPAATTPAEPQSVRPSPRIVPARSSHSPDRPFVDVGYDEEDADVPLAQQQVHLLASLRGTTPSSPQRQAPSPPRPGVRQRASSALPSLSSSSLNASAQPWKAEIKSEVLPRPPAQETEPQAEKKKSEEEESDGHDGSPSPFTAAGRLPTSSTASPADGRAADGAVLPVIPITSIPRSPVSVASSIATDTPRSILRHPGSAREARPSGSGRRRISFVDLSPLRDDSSSSSSSGSPRADNRRNSGNRHRRDAGEREEVEEEEDEYDFAEPLLRYDSDVPRASPERVVRPGRSPTQSPPRNTPSIGAVASAPPPPEEESDVVTLDTGPPTRIPRLQHPPPSLRRQDTQGQPAHAAPSPTPPAEEPSSPEVRDAARREGSGSRGRSSGRDEDVLTQPHNQSTRGSPSRSAGGAAAAVQRRLPARQRWPSEAYVDEPPTEVSVTQRGARHRPQHHAHSSGGHRESLDPEDDMGSTTSSSGSGQSDSAAESDREAPVVFNSPVKAPHARTPSPEASPISHFPHRGGSPRDRTRSPSQSQRTLNIGRLPERRGSSASASASRASSLAGSQSSHSSAHRERPIPATPSSIMEDRQRERRSLSSSGSGRPPTEQNVSSADHSTLLPPLETERSGAARGGVAQPVPRSREGSAAGSQTRSPSSITERSPVRRAGEAASHVAAVQRTSSAPSVPPVMNALSRPATVEEEEEEKRATGRHRHKHRHRSSSSRSSTSEAPRHSSKRSTSSSSAQSSPHKPVSPTPQPVGAAKRAKKPTAARERESTEVPVYVDPLLRERQHRHNVARQETPAYLAEPASATATAAEIPLLQHKMRQSSRRASAEAAGYHGGSGVGSAGEAQQPVSLRDIMTRHDSPAQKRSKPTSRDASQRSPPSRHVEGTGERRVAQQPTARKIFRDAHDSHNTAATAARASSPQQHTMKGTEEDEQSVSSGGSSGGVAADQLDWNTSTPPSRRSSASPPPTPGSSSSALQTTTPGGHKVFRKKLVTLLRRRKSGAEPSDTDPIVKMSMVPFREGSPAVQRAREQREIASSGSAVALVEDAKGGGRGGGTDAVPSHAPPLERLIDHIHPGRRSSVSSRRSSRSTHTRDALVGEKDGDDAVSGGEDAPETAEVAAKDRLQFRRALSAASLSSRNASRRSSVAPSAASRRSRSSSLLRSPPKLADTATAEVERRSSAGAVAMVAAADSRRGSAGSVKVVEATELKRNADSRAASVVGSRRASRDSAAAAASVMAEKDSPRKDESTMTPTRHRHRHVSRRSHATPSESATSTHRHRHRRRSTSTSSGAQPSQPAARKASLSSAISADDVRQRSTSVASHSLPAAPYRPTQNDEFYGAGMHREAAQLAQDSGARLGITKVSMSLLPRLALEADRGGQGPRGNAEAGGGGVAWSVASSGDQDDEMSRRPIEQAPWDGRGVGSAPQLLQASAAQMASQEPNAVAGWQGGEESGRPDSAAATHLAAVLPPAPAAAPALAAAFVNPPIEEVALLHGDIFAANRAAHNPLVAAGAASPADAEALASFVKRRGTPTPNTAVPPPAHPSAPPSYAPPYALYGQAPAYLGGGGAVPYTGGFAPPPLGNLGASTAVPLFVPPLTVDSVSHLSQDWQSTLRERSGAAKQSAMQQFLIASAEAGAASTLSGGGGSATNVGGMQGGANYLTGAAPLSTHNGHAVSGPAAGAQAPWSQTAQRQWPAQTQPGLPSREFYGQVMQQQPQQQQQQQQQQPSTAAPHAAHSSPPRLLPQAFWEAEKEVRHEEARAAAAGAATTAASAVGRKAKVTAAPKAQSHASPATTTARRRDSADGVNGPARDSSRARLRLSPPPEDYDLVEGSDSSRSAGTEEVVEVDAVERLSPPPSRTTRSLTPPTAAADLSDHSALRDDTPPAAVRRSLPAVLSPAPDTNAATEERRRSRGEAASTRKRAAAAAIAAASGGRAKPSTTARAAFTITSPMTEPLRSTSARAGEKPAGRHASTLATQRRPRERSAHFVASTASPPRKQRHDAEKRGAKMAKEERKRHGAEDEEEAAQRALTRRSHRSHRRHSRSRSAASLAEALFSIPDMFDAAEYYSSAMEPDSDVDSDMATSMEFQLSRLLLRREQEVSVALSALQQERDKAQLKKERRAEKKEKREKEEKERSSRHRRRSPSSDTKEAVKKGKGKDEKQHEKERKKKKEERKRKKHRSTSATSAGSDKKSHKDKARRDKHRHRSSSASGSDPADPPSHPLPHYTFPAADESVHHAERATGGVDDGYSPYSPSRGALHSARHYPASASFATAGKEELPPSASARSFYHPRSSGGGGGDGDYGGTESVPRSRYGASPYSTFRRQGEEDGPASSRYSRPNTFTPAPSYRRGSPAGRPSTSWTDYVREAERSEWRSPRDRLSSTPSSASPRYESFGHRRRSTGADSAQPRRTSPPPAYRSSYSSRAADYDDIDDIPHKSYFNRESGGDTATRRSADAAAGAAASSPPSYTSRSNGGEGYTNPYRSPFKSEGPQPTSRVPPNRTDTAAAAASSAAASASTGTRRNRTRKDDDILVSTPSHDRDGSYDYWEPTKRETAEKKRAAPPPPPPPLESTPPDTALSGSTRAPSVAEAAGAAATGARGSAALPIVTEHAVTDAQAAKDFTEGVQQIITALKQYRGNAA